MQDPAYRDFHSNLMPGIDKDTIIGIRTPQLRRFAKQLAQTAEAEQFLHRLPHQYYEENNLHMMLVAQIKDYESCLAEVERFLPYVDNWATCDLPAPKCFEKHKKELITVIRKWISSEKIYVVRYGIGLLLRLYLDADFDPAYLELVTAVQSEEYYVNMMIARICPTAMIFVPSVKGISHNPEEYTKDEDVLAGAGVFLDVVMDMAVVGVPAARNN